MIHPIRSLKTAFHTFIATCTELAMAVRAHTAVLQALLESARRTEEHMRYLAASDRHSRETAGLRTNL